MPVEHTQAMEHCDQCPPVSEWPMRHLITGTCPRCGALDEDRAFREIKAREAIAERTRPS